jgi:hypothetical protein
MLTEVGPDTFVHEVPEGNVAITCSLVACVLPNICTELFPGADLKVTESEPVREPPQPARTATMRSAPIKAAKTFGFI